MFLHGVVNASPDSVDEASVATDHDGAVARADWLLGEGADGFDLGGQGSTAASAEVDEAAEWGRVEPVLATLVGLGREVSIDTYRPGVAERALAAGAVTLNAADGMQSKEMWEVAAQHRPNIVVPFLPGPNARVKAPVPSDPIPAMVAFFEERLEEADRWGLRDRCWLDPGIGFVLADRPWPERFAYQRRVASNLDGLRTFGLPLYCQLPWRDEPDHRELLDLFVAGRLDHGRTHAPGLARAAEARAA